MGRKSQVRFGRRALEKGQFHKVPRQRPTSRAPRSALLYTRLSREEFGDIFLGLMVYLNPKGAGDNRILENQRTPRRRQRWAAGGPARYGESLTA